MLFACIACGAAVCEVEESYGHSWWAEYRAVCSDPAGDYVTGVGCLENEYIWSAPREYARRWDDRDFNASAQDELSVMSQPPVHGRHAFVVHDACWQLLQKLFLPGTVPTGRLLEICESLPFPLAFNGLYWGHDYGGLLELNPNLYHPWQEQYVQVDRRSAALSSATEDPYATTELLKVPINEDEWLAVWTWEGQARDCFARLPWELRETIAVNLPTNAALRLRLASAAFLPLLTSGIFWRSRFRPGRERGFLFEKWFSRDNTHWLTLYRLTAPGLCTPALENRRRIWNTIEPLVDLTSLRLAKHSVDATDEPFVDEDWNWASAHLNIVSHRTQLIPFREGCRVFGTQIIQIPTDLQRIALSFSFMGRCHLTGLRLISRNGAEVCLGYISKAEEVSDELTSIRGFKVAVRLTGIAALKVISGDGHDSGWFGQPGESPITHTLADLYRVGRIAASFDGWKIVRLGTSQHGEKPSQSITAPSQSLRSSALWYPTVPNYRLNLNEALYTGQPSWRSGYRPVIWAHFGGVEGARLQHLTGISIYSDSRLCCIDFFYDQSEVADESCRLGLSSSTKELPGPQFVLDGPNGERIQSIEVSIQREDIIGVDECLRHGVLEHIEITTNRSRSYGFGEVCDDAYQKQLSVSEGTVMTGLYATQDPGWGLLSLGLVSVVVSDIGSKI